MNFCPKCGNENEPGDVFCKECGSKLHLATGENSEIANDNSIKDSHLNTNQNTNQNNSNGFNQNMVKCPYCGAMVNSSVQKCMNCGEWLYSKPQDEEHGALIVLGYILAIIIPIVGLVIGLYLLTRDNEKDHKAGKYQVILAICMFVIAALFFVFVMATMSSYVYYF